MITRILIALSLCGALCSCSWFRDPPPPPSNNDHPQQPGIELIGRVASVSRDRSFVLIQRYQNLSLPMASILTSRGPNERMANLRISGERLGNFDAADLQSGNVEVGDGVYFTMPPAMPNSNAPIPNRRD